MIETDKKTKTQRQAEFMQKHTLTPEETKKLIQDKLARARAYSEAWRKREALLVESR
jgi:excinuclease UvrABC helicase subunit UvrB